MKRMLFTGLITLAISAALFAQGGRGGLRGGGGPLGALKNALGLTDAQVTAITAVIQTEQTRMQGIRSEVQQKRQTLDTLLGAASPAPIDVGNAAISLHASEAKVKAEEDYLIGQVKQQLTGDQQQKLDTLIAANAVGCLSPDPAVAVVRAAPVLVRRTGESAGNRFPLNEN